jgi:small redox-active disulfide protein 2
MLIELFSTNCVKCRRLEFNLQQAIGELGIEVDLRKVSDIAEMERRGIRSVPALVIDGDIKMVGVVARVCDLKELIMGRPGPFE